MACSKNNFTLLPVQVSVFTFRKCDTGSPRSCQESCLVRYAVRTFQKKRNNLNQWPHYLITQRRKAAFLNVKVF